jgi:hypothetical protein
VLLLVALLLSLLLCWTGLLLCLGLVHSLIELPPVPLGGGAGAAWW